MQQYRSFFGARRAASAPRQSAAMPLWRRAGLFITALALGVLFCSTPERSLSDVSSPTVQVYLYNADGSATNVTSACFYVGSQAYVFPDHPMAITLAYQEGYVYDPYAHVIGYLLSQTPPW